MLEPCIPDREPPQQNIEEENKEVPWGAGVLLGRLKVGQDED